jgi:alanyl-tRNA synthetase
LRFDFSHEQAVDDETLSEIENAINEAILLNQPVGAEHMARQEAIDKGAMALFGEKYGDIVRTVKIGDGPKPYSLELCGGLHVGATGDIGLFRFTGEEAVGAGLRRVEAVTGRHAQSMVSDRLATLNRLVKKLKVPLAEVETRLDAILSDNQSLSKEVTQLRRLQARSEFEILMGQMQEVGGVPLMVGQVNAVDMDGIREIADWFRDRISSGVVVLGAIVNGRVLLVVVVTEDLVERGIKAGNIVGKVAKMVDGGGGGRPTLAQAGGKNPDKLPQALEAVQCILEQELNA